MISVRERAHRILRQLGNYRSGEQIEPGSLSDLGYSVSDPRNLIGLYLNDPPGLKDAVVITSTGVQLASRGGAFLPYRSIREVIGPGEADPRDASGVRVTLLDGDSVLIPVAGGTDEFRDAWEFMRFLSRVVEDAAAE